MYVRSYFYVRNRAFVNSVDSTHRSSCACEYVCVHNIYNFCFKIAYIVSQLASRLLNNFGVATSVRVLVYSQLRVHLYILCYFSGYMYPCHPQLSQFYAEFTPTASSSRINKIYVYFVSCYKM